MTTAIEATRHTSTATASTVGPKRAMLLSVGMTACVLWGLDLWHLQRIRPALDESWFFGLALVLVVFTTIALSVAVLALVQILAASAFCSLALRLPGWRGEALATLLTAGLLSPLLFVMARQPFMGNRYRDTPVALWGPWVVLAVMILLALVCLWSGYLLLRLLFSDRASPRLVRTAVASLIALSGMIVAADTLWYPGWYPLVHAALSVTSAILVSISLAVALFHMGALRSLAKSFCWLTAAILMVGLPLGTWSLDSTLAWRISSGTLFASRVATPLRLMSVPAGPTFADLEGLPPIDSRHLYRLPAVLGEPPPLASTALLVTVDTLRADILGLYGSTKGVTPNIDEFFADGYVFERVYSQYAATRHSVRAILESRFPQSPTADADDGDVINRLRDNDIQVIGLLPEDMRMFVHVDRYNFSAMRFYEDQSSVPSLLRELTAGLRSTGVVIWVHLYQPHDPYEPPDNAARGKGARVRYEEEVRAMDRQFQDVLSVLPWRPDLVMLGADHGEEFWEHGGVLHGRTVYDETIRVPLLLKIANRPGERRRQIVGNVDIAPTLLAALGIAVPEQYEGYDLLERASVAPDDRVIFAEAVTNLVAAISERWKWIHHSRLDFWELYDLERDPAESRNLARSHPDVLAVGQGLLWAYEYETRMLPTLRTARVQEVEDWLRRYDSAESRFSVLGRWSGFRAAAHFKDHSDVASRLRSTLARESDQFVRMSLSAALQPEDLTASGSVAGGAALLRELLGVSGELDEASLRGGLLHPLSAVRRLAAEMLIVCEGVDAAASLDISNVADNATRRGLTRGLIGLADGVPTGIFRQLLADADVDVRIAAVRGLYRQEGTESSGVLVERLAVERSPSVRKLLLEYLLDVDRPSGLDAIRTEIARPTLSDYVRAKLIAEKGVTEESRHLLDLFAGTKSISFRSELIRLASRMELPPAEFDEIIRGMHSHAFQPALRARLGRLLKRAS